MSDIDTITFTGYENQGFVAFIQGASVDANPYVNHFHGHTEWVVGYETARARHALGEDATTAPLPIYTVRDQATASMDPRGYRVTFARLGANWSKASAQEHANQIKKYGRLAEVLEITPAQQLEIFAGEWDGFTATASLAAPVTPGDWESAA
ncbi:hypothetical protein [Roseobacter litoralis]|uniref:hypothetical protein n=1 Tax=Roseobacter litoralis TaxID=42443 RepID=UPI00249595F8|nr:hypothetical protein [Roseobacter litoralis]